MGKQTEIPGTEREVNKRVEDVMQVLDSKRKAKTRASTAHKDAEPRVIQVMREEKLKTYTSVDLGLTVDIDEVEKPKLSAYHPPDAEKAKSKKPEAEA